MHEHLPSISLLTFNSKSQIGDVLATSSSRPAVATGETMRHEHSRLPQNGLRGAGGTFAETTQGSDTSCVGRAANVNQ